MERDVVGLDAVFDPSSDESLHEALSMLSNSLKFGSRIQVLQPVRVPRLQVLKHVAIWDEPA